MTTTDRSTVMSDAVSTVSLARDLQRHGRHKTAEALLLQAATHVERILGPHDPGLAKILDAYVEFLVSLRREADAVPSGNARIKSGNEPSRLQHDVSQTGFQRSNDQPREIKIEPYG